MTRRRSALLHVSIKHSVVALDEATGHEVWRVKLKGGGFVTVYRSGDRVFAANQGEVFCLDAATGAQVWHNPMRGLGLGLVSLATEPPSPPAAPYVPLAEELKRRARQHAAAGSG